MAIQLTWELFSASFVSPDRTLTQMGIVRAFFVLKAATPAVRELRRATFAEPEVTLL